jgi:hypothetical protein
VYPQRRLICARSSDVCSPILFDKEQKLLEHFNRVAMPLETGSVWRRQFCYASTRRPACHRIFDKADNGRHNGAGDAAAHRLAEHLADIDTTGSPLKHWQQRSEKRPTPRAAKCPGNGVAERTQIEILHPCTCGIAAYRAGDELDDDIDKCG